MTASDESLGDWIREVQSAFDDGSLVKVTFNRYEGKEPGLKRILVRPVLIKDLPCLSFTYRYQTRDIIKNEEWQGSFTRLAQAFESGFRSGTLLVTSFQLTCQQKSNGTCRLRRIRASHTAPDWRHDRSKQRLIKPKAYLQALGVTAEDGSVLPSAQDKYRQINRYIELLSLLITPDFRRVVDMGSGKGYLTFALYDYMTSAGVMPEMTGVEQRPELVAQCNGIAQESGFTGLHFQQGSIQDFNAEGIDLLIALHACDTATDDALAKGIVAGAECIVVAPCCHRQIRREMEKGGLRTEHDFLLRHGILLERQADMVTDGLRALFLEQAGYRTRIFEFISDAHTAKNIMITGQRQRRHSEAGAPGILESIQEAKARFGIRTHYLEIALARERKQECGVPGPVE